MDLELRKVVDALMLDQKLSESQAIDLCSASLNAADQGITFDTSQQFKATIDEDSGFLTAPVTLARTGVQYYYGFELGLKDRALEKIGVYRSPEEVFHDDSVKSYINLVATDDHPSELVTTDNVKQLQVGSVSDVKPVDNKTLVGIVTITDKAAIGKIKSGKIEVSVGYKNKYVKQSGFFNGDAYEFIQIKIRANHLAIVDAGRCGPACKLTIDHITKEKTTMIKVTIDGISYDVEDTLGQAIIKQQNAHDEEKKEMKKKFEKKEGEDEEEKKELKKEKEEANAAKDAALSKVLNDKAIDALVEKRADLLSTAKEILGDKMPECTDCEKELKTAVIDHVLNLDIDDWSAKTMDYINPSYDIAVGQFKKVKTSLDNFSKDINAIMTKDGKTITRQTAQAKYQKDHLGIGKEV